MLIFTFDLNYLLLFSVLHQIDPYIFFVLRSSEDEYCPPVQVDAIQQSLLQMLADHYPDIKTEKSYE